MCGIAGALRLARTVATDLAPVVSRMTEWQRHRGPDGGGLWSSEDGDVVLGHRRLAIIDTGVGGAQPMSDATGRWVVTFNGEIYNYRALRLELERLGVVFRTESDTEVLVNVVDRWGEEGLGRLRGMFSFGLWDTRHRELWLARDPYGIKPLHYGEGAGGIWFASQGRALATEAPLDVSRDPAALVALYLWGHVPEPLTWWEGIRMLPAGHVWRLRPDGPMSVPVPFCRVEDTYVAAPSAPLAPGELRRLVTNTVEHHLVADVEVGVFLSAGIDSGVLAATAAELGQRPRTITLAFREYEGMPQDEAPLAEETARAIGADHQTVRIGRADFDELFATFMDRMDSPSIDGLNTYLVSHAAASQGLKVALSGLGADELFGGYPSFAQIPRFLRLGTRLAAAGPLAGMAARLLRGLQIPGVPPKAAGLLTYSCGVPDAYLLRRSLFLPDELDRLLDESWIAAGLAKLDALGALGRTVEPLRVAGAPLRSQISALESCWYMRNQLLRDTDWASMAHGLEVRVPFVDIDLLRRVAPSLASSRPPTKDDLALCAPALPAAVRNRRKTGFTTPVGSWVRRPREGRARGLRGWVRHVHREFAEGGSRSAELARAP